MYDIIIFNDFSRYTSAISYEGKTAGGYKIANHLRQLGYKVKTIHHLNYLLSNHKKELFDYLDLHLHPNIKFVGFSKTFMDIQNPELFKELFKHIDQKGIKILIGGWGASTSKLLKYQEVTCLIAGLAESSIEYYLQKNPPIYNKTLKYDIHGSSYDFHNSNGIFHETDVIAQKEMLPIELSRGCRFKCKFCSYPLLGRNPNDLKYIKSEEQMANEFAFNYANWKTTNYLMMCDTFNETTDKLLTVQRALKKAKVNINFASYIRLELLHAHPEQISILRDLGIKSAQFGLESLHHPSAKAVGKGLHPDKVLETLQKCKDVWGSDSILHASFIIGLPYDTPSTVFEWSSKVMNRQTPLDSWIFKPLVIYQKRNLFQSEFELESEKYGYTLINDTGDWKNENWNYEQTKKIAEYLQQLTTEKQTKKIFSWGLIGYTTFGYSFEYLSKLFWGTPEFKKFEIDYSKKRDAFLLNYANEIFKY